MSDELKVQARGLNKKFLFIAIVLVVIGLIAALVLLIPTSAKAKKVEEQLNLGAKYLSELDYEQAIVAYEAVIKIDPKCEEAYLALADIYIATGDFEKAEDILKQAEEAIGEDVTVSVETKKQEVEKVREEQKVTVPTATPSPTSTSVPSPTEEPSPTVTPSPTSTPTPVGWKEYDGTTVELSKAKVGDVVLFGSYEQDNITSNGVEEIPWYVLDKDGDNLLLMSVYLLERAEYNEEYTSITWEECTLRQWMNDDFYNSAFTKSEKKQIRTSHLKNADNPWYGTEGGNDTEDKVFALSVAEAEQYFGTAEKCLKGWDSASPELSAAKVTAYAEAQGAYVSSYESTASNGWWWLRSPGYISKNAAIVLDGGIVNVGGGYVDHDKNAARPALWLNLNP